MLIKIRGATYPSVKTAAEAEGVTANAIYSALNRGNIDTVGMGKSQPQPVELDGIAFPSIRAASLALGFSRTYLGKVLSKGGDKSYAKLLAALTAYREKME
jgi:hypothetical protein